MISKIIPWDIFSPKLQPWEDRVFIAAWTNTLWINDSNWNSVASQIWRINPDFYTLWRWKIWDIHVRDFWFWDRVATALWIVCNENTNLWNSDILIRWLSFWFDKILEITLPRLIDKKKAIQDLKSNLNFEVFTFDDTLISYRVKTHLDEYNAKICPIIRTTLIWNWESWTFPINQVAEVVRIIYKSWLNFHLYLSTLEQQKIVSEIIPLIPTIRPLAWVEWYNEICELI